jgi:succinoglycan biosynthesis protein ExoA
VTQSPFVSVVIPALDEARHIADSLASVVAQTYPHDRMEVIVADGGSTDATRDIVADWGTRHPFIRLIDNPAPIQAAGLNRAIEASKGDVIARLDAHAAWAPNHLALCVELLEETGADNVGGTMQVVSESALGGAIGCATSSPFGIGGARYRYAQRQQEVDTVWLGCMRRSALDRVGLYDESLAVHEDYELNHGIRSSGGSVVFSPALPTRYWPRDSWQALGRQYFRYGRGAASAVDLLMCHHRG